MGHGVCFSGTLYPCNNWRRQTCHKGTYRNSHVRDTEYSEAAHKNSHARDTEHKDEAYEDRYTQACSRCSVPEILELPWVTPVFNRPNKQKVQKTT